MLKFKDYKNSKDFGRAVHEEFIISYSVDIDLSADDELKGAEFAEELFKRSSNPKLYCKILENLTVNECHPKCFYGFVDNMRVAINSYVCNELVSEAFNRFVNRNKPFVITDLNDIGYSVCVISDKTVKMISSFDFSEDNIILQDGIEKFDYTKIKGEFFNRQVIYPDVGVVKYSRVDHLSKQVYLYC